MLCLRTSRFGKVRYLQKAGIDVGSEYATRGTDAVNNSRSCAARIAHWLSCPVRWAAVAFLVSGVEAEKKR